MLIRYPTYEKARRRRCGRLGEVSVQRLGVYEPNSRPSVQNKAESMATTATVMMKRADEPVMIVSYLAMCRANQP